MIGAINDPGVDTAAWLADRLMDPNYSFSIPQVVGFWSAMKDVVDQYGIDLIAYEGGQHVHQAFGIQGITQAELDVITPFMSDFTSSPEMADLYEQLWGAWAAVSDGPFMHSEDVSAATDYGSWGLLSALGDTNARWELVQMLAQTTTPWWTDSAGRASLPDPKIVRALSGGGKHRVEVGSSGGTIDGDASGQNAMIFREGSPADFTCARDPNDPARYTYTHDTTGAVYLARNCQAVGWSG